MKKETNTGDVQVESGAGHRKPVPGRQRSVNSAPTVPASIPNTQQESRSDQEQEGTQNPAGDTRDVSREPVAEDVSDVTKK